MTKLAYGAVLVVAMALGCATQAPPPSPEPRGPADFEPEPTETMPTQPENPRGVEDLSSRFQTIYFAFDDSSLTSQAKGSLRANAGLLQQEPRSRLEIQGNCDERGTNEYNLALGQRRADAARQYLVDLGIDPGRLSTVTFGEENPSVIGHTEAAWAKNRRDDFQLR